MPSVANLLAEHVRSLRAQEPPPPVEGVRLPVPYLSQNGPDANLSTTDCGPASLAMVMGYLGTTVTVNQVFLATGAQPENYITLPQMQAAATHFGFVTERLDRPNLRELARSGNAPVCLVNAHYLAQQTYQGPHIVVVTGIDTDDILLIHDPNQTLDGSGGPYVRQPNFDLAWGKCFEQQNPNYVAIILEKTPPPVPPPSNVTIGVGMANPQPLTQTELNALGRSKVRNVKLLTLGGPDECLEIVNAVRRVKSDMNIIARLFFKPDAENKSKFSPEVFVETVLQSAKTYYSLGIRYFEVHNEPNLQEEGNGWNWIDGSQFSAWLLKVLQLLRAQMPEAKFGYPGLSPQDNYMAFLIASSPAVASCDWVGAHSYWHYEGSGKWGMESLDGGMNWLNVRNAFPQKPIIVTEFSNNNPAESYENKGLQYLKYASLVRFAGAAGFYSFALSWPGRDTNREGWVVNNAMTAIPGIIGDNT